MVLKRLDRSYWLLLMLKISIIVLKPVMFCKFNVRVAYLLGGMVDEVLFVFSKGLIDFFLTLVSRIVFSFRSGKI